MSNIILKLGTWWLLICIFNGLKGQDPQFSQFYNSSLYYNPATAGISQDLRYSVAYRNLWSNIPGDLSSYFFSVDYQWTKRNVGVGFLMFSDNEGLYNLRTQRLELVYSYRIQSHNKMLQFGMSLFSLNMKDFKNEDFVFTGQLDPVYGIVQQNSFVLDEIESVVYPDWNIGLVYRQNFKRPRLTPTIGISASHIFRPNISFLDDRIRLPVKYVVYSSFLTRITFNTDNVWERKRVFLNPGFVYEHQDPFQTFTIGSGFDVYPLRFGLWFRTKNFLSEVHKFNSVIVHAGIVIPIALNHNIMLDYSYDSTISELEFSSGGAHEITLIYNVSLPERKKMVDCFVEWWRAGQGIMHHSKK
ncbi:MAG: PorP/SprF family type IX secretion system membrane protein [Bacteroidales bacterium]